MRRTPAQAGLFVLRRALFPLAGSSVEKIWKGVAHGQLVDAFRRLANDSRFSERYMEVRRDPQGDEGFKEQIRVATGGDRETESALEAFAAARGLRSSTAEVGMTSRRGPP